MGEDFIEKLNIVSVYEALPKLLRNLKRFECVNDNGWTFVKVNSIIIVLL